MMRLVRIVWVTAVTVCLLLGMPSVCSPVDRIQTKPMARRSLLKLPGPKRTSYAEMMDQLASLVSYDRSSRGGLRMWINRIGKSVHGRGIWVVTLGNRQHYDNPRVLVICRQHGDEPASTEAALRIIREAVYMANPDILKWISQATLYLIPMANPDGAERFQRENARQVDLNRDWLRASQPETQAIIRIVDRLHPDFLVDAHERSPHEERDDCTEIAVSASSDVILAARDFQGEIEAATQDAGRNCRPVATSGDLRLAHRFFAVKKGIPSILLESRQTGKQYENPQRRQSIHYTSMLAALRTVSSSPFLVCRY